MKKLYLVACFDNEECIRLIKQMFLRIKIDIQNATLSRQNQSIEGPTFVIYFRSISQLANGSTKGMTFNGLVRTKRCRLFANFESRAAFERHRQRTTLLFEKNDVNDFLQFYLRKVAKADELFSGIS